MNASRARARREGVQRSQAGSELGCLAATGADGWPLERAALMRTSGRTAGAAEFVLERRSGVGTRREAILDLEETSLHRQGVGHPQMQVQRRMVEGRRVDGRQVCRSNSGGRLRTWSLEGGGATQAWRQECGMPGSDCRRGSGGSLRWSAASGRQQPQSKSGTCRLEH